MKPRILIADDEPLARERLARLVQALPDYTLCGEAANGAQVLEAVVSLQPDILLLDIRMPGLDGMAVARQLAQMAHPPAIIFCTAYDQYALDAFAVRATAYLLKPVRAEALLQALQAAHKVNRLQLDTLSQRKEGPAHLITHDSRGSQLIALDDIFYCTADQKYVTLVHRQGETLTDFTLKSLETDYPSHFLRIHRNCLVATLFLQALLRGSDGQSWVQLRDNPQRLLVSRRHLTQVKAWFDQRAGER